MTNKINSLNACTTIDDLSCFINQLDTKIGTFGGRRFVANDQSTYSLKDITRHFQHLLSLTPTKNQFYREDCKPIFQNIKDLNQRANETLSQACFFKRVMTAVKHAISSLNFNFAKFCVNMDSTIENLPKKSIIEDLSKKTLVDLFDEMQFPSYAKAGEDSSIYIEQNIKANQESSTVSREIDLRLGKFEDNREEFKTAFHTIKDDQKFIDLVKFTIEHSRLPSTQINQLVEFLDELTWPAYYLRNLFIRPIFRNLLLSENCITHNSKIWNDEKKQLPQQTTLVDLKPFFAIDSQTSPSSIFTSYLFDVVCSELNRINLIDKSISEHKIVMDFGPITLDPKSLEQLFEQLKSLKFAKAIELKINLATANLLIKDASQHYLISNLVKSENSKLQSFKISNDQIGSNKKYLNSALKDIFAERKL